MKKRGTITKYILKDGEIIWMKNLKYHREDGPAIIHPDGKEEYWLDGVQVTREEVMGE